MNPRLILLVAATAAGLLVVDGCLAPELSYGQTCTDDADCRGGYRCNLETNLCDGFDLVDNTGAPADGGGQLTDTGTETTDTGNDAGPDAGTATMDAGDDTRSDGPSDAGSDEPSPAGDAGPSHPADAAADGGTDGGDDGCMTSCDDGGACTTCCDADLDGYGEGCENGPDCNDNDDTIHTLVQGYVDADHDGHPLNTMATACSDGTLPLGYVADAPAEPDCNDTNAEVYMLRTVYIDADLDGHSGEGPIVGCGTETLPPGYLESGANDDCNDFDADQFPGNPEVCDGLDNDCDGVADTEAVCGCPVQNLGDPLHPYLVCPGPTDWTQARAFCRARAGYDLVVVNDTTEYDGLVGLKNGAGLTEVMIGFTDSNIEGLYIWVDGSFLLNAPWLDNQPDNSTGQGAFPAGEDCGEIWTPPAGGGATGFNDIPCAGLNRAGWVCEPL